MPLGFLLIATKRYIKTHWKLMHILHAVLGSLTLGITLWQTVEIGLAFGFGLLDDIHSVLGTIGIAICIFVCITGCVAAAMMGYSKDKAWTPQERATMIGKIHRYSGYAMILFANIVVTGGTITYSLKSLKDPSLIAPAFINFLIFINILLVSEYCYRKKAKSDNLIKNEKKITTEMEEKPQDKKLKVWTPQMVDKQVEEG